MIKGVSKQILEVTNTDNPYFDKIIFCKARTSVNRPQKTSKRSRGSCGFKAKTAQAEINKAPNNQNRSFIPAFYNGGVRYYIYYYIISIGEI